MTRNAFGIPVSDSLCPDCDADYGLVDMGAGVTVLQILHDDTCPALAAREAGRR